MNGRAFCSACTKIIHRHCARLRQGHRRAHGCVYCTAMSGSARHDEPVQCLVRPGAHDRARCDRPARCRKRRPWIDWITPRAIKAPLSARSSNGMTSLPAAGAGGIHVPRQYRDAHGAHRAGLYLPRCRVAGIPARQAAGMAGSVPLRPRPSRPGRARSIRPRRCWRALSGP